MNQNASKNLLILSLTMIVIALGFGMVMPIFPFYIERMGISGGAYGLLIASYALMQMIFAPIWGSVSDQVGRKPILALGILGNAITLLLMGIATDYWMLLISRALSGIISSAALPTTLAYVSDSTTEKERGGGMGRLGAASALGLILGPGLGGLLAGDSLSLPFFLAAGLSLLCLLLTLLFLPESLPPEARVKIGAKGQPRLLRPGDLWRALAGPLGLLLFLAFLVSFGMSNFQAIFGLYAVVKYGYDTTQVGVILMVVALLAAVGQGLLTGPITERYGEERVIRAALLFSALGFVLMLMARSYPAVLVTVAFFELAKTLIRPAVTSLTSQRAAGGQGTVMGLNNAFLSLGQILGPLWAGFVFDLHPNLPYLSGAIIALGGFFVCLARLRPPKTVPADSSRLLL